MADKPTANYPANDAQIDKHFTFVELSDGGTFIGETKQGIPNGLGLVMMAMVIYAKANSKTETDAVSDYTS